MLPSRRPPRHVAVAVLEHPLQLRPQVPVHPRHEHAEPAALDIAVGQVRVGVADRHLERAPSRLAEVEVLLRDDAGEGALRPVVGAALARQKPARHDVEPPEVQELAAGFPDEGMEEFRLEVERPVHPRDLGADGPRPARVDVAGVDDVGRDVALRARLVAHHARGGILDAEAQPDVKQSRRGRVVGVDLVDRQARDPADEASEALRGVAVLARSGARAEDAQLEGRPLAVEGLADLEARFDARRDGLERGRRFHQRDVPAAGDDLEAHRRLELAEPQRADVVDLRELEIRLLEVELIRDVAELELVAERHEQDGISFRQESQAPQLHAVVEPRQVARRRECGARPPRLGRRAGR